MGRRIVGSGSGSDGTSDSGRRIAAPRAARATRSTDSAADPTAASGRSGRVARSAASSASASAKAAGRVPVKGAKTMRTAGGTASPSSKTLPKTGAATPASTHGRTVRRGAGPVRTAGNGAESSTAASAHSSLKAGRAAKSGKPGRTASSEGAPRRTRSDGRSKELAPTAKRTLARASAHDGDADASARPRAARAVEGHAGEPHGGPATGFVDARRMPSDDVVARTLGETAGTLGVLSRPKVVDFTARRKERRMADLRATAVRVVAAVLAAAAVAGLVWLLFFSTVFRLEKSAIEISGDNAWVSRDDIMAIAGKQAGRSLFLVSTNDVADALGDIPGVTEASVDKRFPKSLTVNVEAQQPAAMLKDSGDELVAVDDRGRELNKVGSASTDGIPVIEVKSVDKALDSKSVKEAIGVLSSLSDSMRASITKVTADTRDSVTTELDGGAHTVVWGDSSQIELKKAIVETILGDPNVIGDKTQIDVSAPSRPIIK
ncbi:cell division protein FtsQ/DivIB [Bifidobacterium samirii]|uniref:Cell division protein n=1 Tax=Bifidobacterium samirii TaxID=2306974 RepID=A0A430FUM3_9BIFI|nr:FtsQ-type POTRA domain-containing protein [Bifidobacterium samirii]RSX57009.1 cell division protein [Bifidobacterium samirii]